MKNIVLQCLKRQSLLITIISGLIAIIIWILNILNSYYPKIHIRGVSAWASNLFLLSSVFILLAFITAGVLFSYFYFKRYFPIKELKQTGTQITKHDLPALSSGLSNLTLGNLIQKMELCSPYPPHNVPQNLQAIAETLHILRDNLSVISDDFNSITDNPCKRLGFIGVDPIAEGKKSAKILSDMLQGKGQVLIATGLRFDNLLESRRKSFHSWIQENTDIKIVDIFESMMNRDFSMNFVEDLLSNYPKLKGIYATDAITTSIISEALSMNKNRIKVKVVGHDITHENVEHIKSGMLDAVLDQNPYVQGYNAVIYLYNHIVEGWIPPKPQMFIPADVISQENINSYWSSDKKWTLSDKLMIDLAQPTMTPPTKAYRIIFLAREDSDIWKRLKTGAFAAAEKLRKQNIRLEWLVPEETRERADFSASVYGKQIKNLVDQKVDGIITFVEDARLISSINEAVSAGVPFMTVNTEPFNLRSLIRSLSEQANRLSHLSTDLAGATQHVIMSTTEIRNAISSITDGSMAQNNQVEKTKNTLDSLLNNIDQISQDANESEYSSENTRKAVTNGGLAVEKTLNTLKIISRLVNNTWHIVEELRKHSNRIDDILDLIKNITSKVNILALNASIEATQSGAYQYRFGQVASDIRRLANSTSEASREVAGIIETIKKDIRFVEKTMRDSTDIIKNSDSLSNETDSALDNIRMLIESDRSRIQRISSAIQEMQFMSHQVGYSMDNVAKASIKNTTGVAQISDSLKEMEIQLENVRTMAKQLEHMANSEDEFLAMFQTDEIAK